MNIIPKLSVIAVMAALPFSANALSIPKASPKDPHVQTATYDPDDVVLVRTRIGRATLIQLESDERINGESSLLGAGDAKAWNLQVRGNNIVFKPAVARPATN